MEHLLVILLSVTFVPFRCLWKFKPLHTNISYILVWIHAEAEIVTQFGGACSPWTARIVLSIQQKLLEQYLFTPTWCTSSILHFALLLAPELLNTVLFFAYFVVRKLHTAPLIVFFYLFFYSWLLRLKNGVGAVLKGWEAYDVCQNAWNSPVILS